MVPSAGSAVISLSDTTKSYDLCGQIFVGVLILSTERIDESVPSMTVFFPHIYDENLDPFLARSAV